ncbi:unnamed protein product [Durusdinium trenchii]|uniref:Uncharacterized protein n=1 Tax=Durusdinium trenchii TaxID=1381693 RepID=A0ABP0RU89_9DINO
MGKPSAGKGKYGKSKASPSRGKGKTFRREEGRSYPDESARSESLKARLINKQREGGEDAKKSLPPEPELDDKATQLREKLMLKKRKLTAHGDKEVETAKFATAGAAARGAAALASTGAASTTRRVEMKVTASPSSPPSVTVEADQVARPTEQPKVASAPAAEQSKVVAAPPAVVSAAAPQTEPPQAPSQPRGKPAKDAPAGAVTAAAGKAFVAAPKLAEFEVPKQKPGHPVPASPGKPLPGKPPQSTPPPKTLTPSKLGQVPPKAEPKARQSSGEKRKALMMALLQRQVSTPRKRPALLATGGAQAMAEVAEELKFQQKWFNENRPRWMPYLSQEAKQYRGVQPFSMQKAQELEDYLKGIGAFKGRVL